MAALLDTQPDAGNAIRLVHSRNVRSRSGTRSRRLYCLFLFLGDNIYADTENMDVMRAKYAPGRLACGDHSTTWDDHDLGVNDGGSEYPKKVESTRCSSTSSATRRIHRQRMGVTIFESR